MARQCFLCSSEIRESFGSVHAGDFLLAIKNEIKKEDIREFCFKCSFSKCLESNKIIA